MLYDNNNNNDMHNNNNNHNTHNNECVYMCVYIYIHNKKVDEISNISRK